MANTTALTPSSKSAVTASSRARTRLTGPTAANFTSLLLAGRNEPFVGEREELVRVDLHAPQLPVVRAVVGERPKKGVRLLDRKSTRLNSSHGYISYAVFCLKKKKMNKCSSR